MEHFLPIGGLCFIVAFKFNSYERTKSHHALSKLNRMLHNCESDNEVTLNYSNATGPRQMLLDNED